MAKQRAYEDIGLKCIPSCYFYNTERVFDFSRLDANGGWRQFTGIG